MSPLKEWADTFIELANNARTVEEIKMIEKEFRFQCKEINKLNKMIYAPTTLPQK